jgi:hypothetical protein
VILGEPAQEGEVKIEGGPHPQVERGGEEKVGLALVIFNAEGALGFEGASPDL